MLGLQHLFAMFGKKYTPIARAVAGENIGTLVTT